MQSQELACLADQLLEVSRIGAGKPRLEYATVDVGQLVANVVTTTRTRIPHRNVPLDRGRSSRVTGES
ncbi:MAG TPA: hypothetical protein VKX96_05725 [Chloroflexota bacterium]|nr:hypothetical protein [Chloroflexota bacterium]